MIYALPMKRAHRSPPGEKDGSQIIGIISLANKPIHLSIPSSNIPHRGNENLDVRQEDTPRFQNSINPLHSRPNLK